MGSSSSKPESLTHLKIIVQEWTANINILRDFLKRYITLCVRYPEKMQQQDPLFMKDIVELFIRMDNFTKVLRMFTVNMLPQHSVNRNLIQEQIDKVPKLQEENSRLVGEKNYLLQENSNINDNIRECQRQIQTLNETSDANCKEKEILQIKNSELHSEMQTLILENRTLRGKLEETGGYVNKEDEYAEKIKELEIQLIQQKAEFEKTSQMYFKDVQAHQYEIKILQRKLNNRESEYNEHKKDKGIETLENLTENLSISGRGFDKNIHNPEDTTLDKSKPESEQTDPYVIESLEKIETVRTDVDRLKREINSFTGTKDDKTFLHLRELLLRNIVKLDNVETEGYIIIREKRREVLRLVRSTLDELIQKAN